MPTSPPGEPQVDQKMRGDETDHQTAQSRRRPSPKPVNIRHRTSYNDVSSKRAREGKSEPEDALFGEDASGAVERVPIGRPGLERLHACLDHTVRPRTRSTSRHSLERILRGRREDELEGHCSSRTETASSMPSSREEGEDMRTNWWRKR